MSKNPEDLTEEIVLKTPYKGTDDKTQVKALDWVVEWATKQGIQLVFINIVKPELSKEEEYLGDGEFIHVNTIYHKKSKSE